MGDGKVIAFIPARGGSKGIKLKNVIKFNGRPLIHWILDALYNSKEIDIVYVATDDLRIECSVENFKDKIRNKEKIQIYHRDSKNAKDKSSTEDVMIEFIKNPSIKLDKNDIFMLVQCTNPFLTTEYVDGAIEDYRNKLEINNEYSILSVVEYDRFLWRKDNTINRCSPVNYDSFNRKRRQDLNDFDKLYLENGSFYLSTVSNIMLYGNRLTNNVGFYIMPKHTYLEIDEPIDLKIGEIICQQKL